MDNWRLKVDGEGDDEYGNELEGEGEGKGNVDGEDGRWRWDIKGEGNAGRDNEREQARFVVDGRLKNMSVVRCEVA